MNWVVFGFCDSWSWNFISPQRLAAEKTNRKSKETNKTFPSHYAFSTADFSSTESHWSNSEFRRKKMRGQELNLLE